MRMWKTGKMNRRIASFFLTLHASLKIQKTTIIWETEKYAWR